MRYHEINLSENWVLYIYPFSDYILLKYSDDKMRVMIDLDKSVIDHLLSGDRIKMQVIPAITLDLNVILSIEQVEQLKAVKNEYENVSYRE